MDIKNRDNPLELLLLFFYWISSIWRISLNLAFYVWIMMSRQHILNGAIFENHLVNERWKVLEAFTINLLMYSFKFNLHLKTIFILMFISKIVGPYKVIEWKKRLTFLLWRVFFRILSFYSFILWAKEVRC